jgi:hypothetical protein
MVEKTCHAYEPPQAGENMHQKNHYYVDDNLGEDMGDPCGYINDSEK